LIYSTKDRSIFTIDLPNLKQKKKALDDRKEDLMIVSVNPLFIVTGNETLHHLDSNLSTISTHKIESPDSLFFIDDGHFYEITRRYDRFYCYDDKREMIWRYTSKERIKESALMHGGLVFITQDSVQYLEIKHKSESRKHFSQYLEV
jgi:outer membrane protein assembly factor BamB